jgi:hypothetical protein
MRKQASQLDVLVETFAKIARSLEKISNRLESANSGPVKQNT